MKQLKRIELNTSELNSFLNGELVFTSILFFESKILFLEDHLERLKKGAHFLLNVDLDLDNLKNEIHEYVKNFSGPLAIRINCIKDGYFFTVRIPPEHKNNLVLAKSAFLKNLSLKPDFLKIPNYLLDLKELELNKDVDDLIFFDSKSFLTEATTSNVFLVDEQNQILTPHVSSVVLDGVIRKNLMNCLSKENLPVIELQISEELLYNSKEIWLTNSLRGIRRVKLYREKKFFSDVIYNLVINKFGQFGEKYYE